MSASIVLGVGEIGQAYYDILSPKYPTYKLDIREGVSSPEIPDTVDILHVCLRFGPHWENTVIQTAKQYRPILINVMTTCPPGTTERLGTSAVHSTTRGLHPHLRDGIMETPKHIGGPKAGEVAAYFREAGMSCITHTHSKTTELAHLLSNAQYATQVLFADEMEKACRHYGTDYFETVMLYARSHNEGYAKMGLHSKMRAILTPPYGRLGGHCISLAAELLDDEAMGPQLKIIRDSRWG